MVTIDGRARNPKRAALGALALGLALSACVTPAATGGAGPSDPATAARPSQSEPRQALLAFLAAADAGDFEKAYRLLSGEWRARYTPARLAADFSAVEAGARDRLARAKIAADREPVVERDSARFPIGGDRSVHLVREADGWKLQALE